MAFGQNWDVPQAWDPGSESWSYAYATGEGDNSNIKNNQFDVPYGSPEYNNQLYGNNWPTTKGGAYDTSLNWGPPTTSRGIQTMNAETPTSKGFGNQGFSIPGRSGVGGTQFGMGTSMTGQALTMPKLGTLPEYEVPTYDEEKVRALTQSNAAPGLRGLRNEVRSVSGKYYENPNVKRMTLRDALAGYGLGLENVMSGAKKEAMAEYQAQYAQESTKAQQEYQAKYQSMMANYQAALKDYFNRISWQY